LADRVIAVTGGTIAGIAHPTAIMQDEDISDRLGVPLNSHRGTSENFSDAAVVETFSRGDSQGTSIIGEDDTAAKADESRKKAEFTIYKYYLENSGYAAVLCYVAAVVVWIFCTEFSSKSTTLISMRDGTRLTLCQAIRINWWSEANTSQGNKDVDFYMGIYVMLGVLGTVGVASAAW
jgi:ATP-binding cassette, subfamily C (CFTR/MRP), member 1